MRPWQIQTLLTAPRIGGSVLKRPHREYVVSVDPGEFRDYTGVAVVRYFTPPPRDPVFAPLYSRDFPELRLVHIERLPLGTTHGARALHVAQIVDHIGRDNTDLLVDATGSGAAFIEAIRRFGFRPVEIVITAGDQEHERPRRDDMGTRDRVTVPNAQFAASLLASLESPPLLKVADGLRFAPVLKAEMLTFCGKRFASGKESYGARGGQHDDMTFSVAYATWWMRRPKPGRAQRRTINMFSR